MNHVLITTLGKANPRNGEQYGYGRYRTLRYGFGNGYVSAPTPFFGKALLDQLRSRNVTMEKIVILGTSGSMWDAWLEVEEELFFAHETFATELQKSVDSDAVSEGQLSEVSRILSEGLNADVSCRLIPYGIDTREQLEMIKIIANSADAGDEAYMDVTHGFRHLPMLEMLSAFLMRSRFRTKGIFYGAADRQQDGVAPTIALDGALRINDWICAIATLKETGNVTPLANLPGMESFRDALLRCQFYEQMNDVKQARRYAKEILGRLDDLPEEGSLFRKDLREVFAWGNENRYALRQFSQGEKAFRNGDYMRAVILFFETVISAELKEDAQNPEKRQEIQDRLNKECGDEWHTLRKLRNSLAHSETVKGRCADKVMAIRRDQESFKKGMEPLIEWVKGRLPR